MEKARLFNLSPGQKLCKQCERKLLNLQKESSSDEEEYHLAPDEQSLEDVDSFNTSFEKLECSPLKQSVRPRDKVRYGKRKVQEASVAVTKKVAAALKVHEDQIVSPDSEEKTCQNCTDFEEVVCSLREKCKTSSKQEKIRLLTLAPKTWSIAKTATEFQVTHYLVRRSRELKKTRGIL